MNTQQCLAHAKKSHTHTHTDTHTHTHTHTTCSTPPQVIIAGCLAGEECVEHVAHGLDEASGDGVVVHPDQDEVDDLQLEHHLAVTDRITVEVGGGGERGGGGRRREEEEEGRRRRKGEGGGGNTLDPHTCMYVLSGVLSMNFSIQYMEVV